MAASACGAACEELSDTPQFRDSLDHEFPECADSNSGINRRDVMKLMAASAAMAGLSACTKLPTEKIVPYVRPPEEIVPGRPLFYATSMHQAGVALGLLVESHMGRPTKVEGNPEHPGSQGGTDVFTQGSILNLYDPDRLRSVVFEGTLSDRSTFASTMGNARVNFETKSTGLRILTGTVTSPTLGAQIKKLLAKFPEAKWHQYEPSGGDSVREGTRLAFGKPMNPVYHFEQADVIVSLDADFLTIGPGHTRYTRDFSRRRDLAEGPASKLNRLYVVEPMPTSTGTMADHRWPLRASDVEGFARQLAAAVGVSVSAGAGTSARSSGRDRRYRARPHRTSRLVHRDCRRASAAFRSRAGACHECGARQHGQNGYLHRIHRSRAGQSDGFAPRSGQRSERGQSRASC